jgi:hypothetical protein
MAIIGEAVMEDLTFKLNCREWEEFGKVQAWGHLKQEGEVYVKDLK